MKSYLYSIFVRFYLAFSGFLVFLLTASLFGADGRGVIGFGTSLFAITGIIFSANLGRTFLALTKKSEDLKKNYIHGFLKLNCILGILAAIAGLTYWYFSESAQHLLEPEKAIYFSATAIFYVWSINGNAFYASFLATKKQENIILITRTCLILFLCAMYFFKEKSIDSFIAWYSLLLCIGSLMEILWLYWSNNRESEKHVKPSAEILKESLFHHIDFLSFNLFPLILTVVLAVYVSKSEVGQFNFALQIINLIFLFSTTANIRLTTYVSDVGYKARISQYKKLFWATISISMFSILALSQVLNWMTLNTHFEQFRGVEWLFISCGLSVPGYVLYQFFSPIWIELQIQKHAAAIHTINIIIFLLLMPTAIEHFGLQGAAWLFSLFHCGLVLCEGYLYSRYLSEK